jgi:hypothetical protein
MGILGKKQQEREEAPAFLRDLEGQMIAMFDAYHDLSLEVTKTRLQMEETNRLLRKLVDQGQVNGGLIQASTGGNLGSANGTDHKG